VHEVTAVGRHRLRGHRTAALLAAALLLLPLGLLVSQTEPARAFPDTAGQPADIQAAIDYVTGKGYMNTAADGNFYPNEPVSRLDYACTVVKVFGKQGEQANPGIHFTDLKDSDPSYKYANIAVMHGYMDLYPDGSFRPHEPHSTVSCLAGLVKGLGLDEPNGPVFSAWGLWPRGPAYSGQSIISSDLHLKHRDTRTWPAKPYPRGELAFSIKMAEQCDEWRMDYARETFNRLSCQSPLAGAEREKALDSAFAKVGYPYVWGGESDAEGGYDCSGLTYFVLQGVLGHPMQRTADDQARDGRYKTVPREQLLPGDAIFWYKDPASSSYVGHAGMYVGRGMFIHSTGSNAGVSVDYLSGYWSDHFAWGKRVIAEPEPDSFDTYILLSNPGGETAQARLTYMLRDGRQVAEERSLEPFSRETVKVDDTLVNEEFSCTVEALQGKVVAERSMYFRYSGQYPGGHVSPGSTAPATDWFLAEGCTDYGFDTYVLIQNPGGEAADVTVTFMTEDGQTLVLPCTVTPYSRYTVTVDKVAGMEHAEFSTRVSSSRPVVVERSMYFDYNGIKEGHNSQGLTSLSNEWYFAEGYTAGAFDTYVLLANPSDTPADVSMVLLGENGASSEITFDISAHARRTVAIDRIKGWSKRAFSIKLHSTQPIAAERAMYFKYNGITGGHDALGCPAPATEWYVAEGYTAGEFDTYILVLNPGDESADLLVRYMLKGGRYLDRMYNVPAHSRYTLAVDGEPGLSSEEVSAVMASSRPVVVERSMYFRYGGRPGGSCAPAVAGPAVKWYFAEGYSGR
jgi:hypothetical protein